MSERLTIAEREAYEERYSIVILEPDCNAEIAHDEGNRSIDNERKRALKGKQVKLEL